MVQFDSDSMDSFESFNNNSRKNRDEYFLPEIRFTKKKLAVKIKRRSKIYIPMLQCVVQLKISIELPN